MYYLTNNAIINGIKRGTMRIAYDCLEVKCSMCGELLPHTKEFFHANGKRNEMEILKTRCKACCFETRHISQIPKTTVIGRPKTNKAQGTCNPIN